jgi:hypothetical protein
MEKGINKYKSGINTGRRWILAIGCWVLVFAGQLVGQTYHKAGELNVLQMEGWQLESGDKDKGLTFSYRNGDIRVRFALPPHPCADDACASPVIVNLSKELGRTQEFIAQRKSSEPLASLGQRQCQLIAVKSRATQASRAILLTRVGNALYEIHVQEKGGDGREFFSATLQLLAGSYVSSDAGGLEASRQALAALQAVQTDKPGVAGQAPPGEDLSGLKKVKEPAAKKAPGDAKTGNDPVITAPPVVKEEPKVPGGNTPPTVKGDPAGSGTSPADFINASSLNIPEPVIRRGEVPSVAFSATDPCLPYPTDGLPWGKMLPDKPDLPEGVPYIENPIPIDWEQFSSMTYRGAVMAAFEGLRMVYGPMPESDFSKFQNAWSPLFDHPTEQVVQYLNALNPLIANFLALRESYFRIHGEIQMVILDAAVAVELRERDAWDAAMTNGSMLADQLPLLENAMKKIALQIEKLGNPPNPLIDKCNAHKRYKSFFQSDSPAGCWSGYGLHIFFTLKAKDANQKSPNFVYVFKVPVNGIDRYYGIQLMINSMGINGKLAHVRDFATYSFVEESLKGKTVYTAHLPGDEDNITVRLQKFTYPDIPYAEEISDKRLFEMIEMDEKRDSTLFGGVIYDWVRTKRMAPVFFALAERWTRENKWDDYEYTGSDYLPEALMQDFSNEIGAMLPKEKPAVEDKPVEVTAPPTPPATDPNAGAAAAEAQALKETIETKREYIDYMRNQIQKARKTKEETFQELSRAKNEQQAKEISNRIQILDREILGIQATIQGEHDLIQSLQTGQYVHTRTMYDEVVHKEFVANTINNSRRMETTRRIAERVDRQIALLPVEQRAKARELARKELDAVTIGSGNLEKAKRLVDAFNNQIQGYAEFDKAMAESAEAEIDENEFYRNMGIMAVGGVVIGAGSAHLVQVYGAESAVALYGSHLLGAAYGGGVGLVEGGPKEAFLQSLNYTSPYTMAAMQFYKGYNYTKEGTNPDMQTRIWQGVIEGGSVLVFAKGFELGARIFSQIPRILPRRVGEVLTTPLINPKNPATVLEYIRNQKRWLEVKDQVALFQRLEMELVALQRDQVANAARILDMQKQLNQLSAGFNSDWGFKWFMKYKADPRTQRNFDRRVQSNYMDMEPGMVRRMDQKGYIMDDIEFVQTRNPSSAGTPSMDLDLRPVSRTTGKEPTVIRKKDGTLATIQEFQDDLTKCMGDEYYQLFKISTRLSDMNITTSVSKESYATARLLEKSFDMSNCTPKEMQSIGTVLRHKVKTIEDNNMLTRTMKMQGKAREASKELENFFLKKLRSDLSKAKPGSPDHTRLQRDIEYWERMKKQLDRIGKEEVNPFELVEINQDIIRQTGGRDVIMVIDDLIRAFK